MEIARRVWARDNRSDVESELELEDSTEVGDDVIFSMEDEGREVVATSAERCDPTAAHAGGEQEAEGHYDVPAPRKHAASTDAVGEWEAKRTWSPCPSEVSPASSPPVVGAVGQARQSEEWAHTRMSSGLAPARDS